MKPSKSPASIFSNLRRLPLEVTFAQVKGWVEQHQLPPENHRSNRWLPVLLARLFPRSDN